MSLHLKTTSSKNEPCRATRNRGTVFDPNTVFGQHEVRRLVRLHRRRQSPCRCEWIFENTAHNVLKLWRSGHPISTTPPPRGRTRRTSRRRHGPFPTAIPSEFLDVALPAHSPEFLRQAPQGAETTNGFAATSVTLLRGFADLSPPATARRPRPSEIVRQSGPIPRECQADDLFAFAEGHVFDRATPLCGPALHECSQCSIEGDAYAIGVREFQPRPRNRHNR